MIIDEDEEKYKEYGCIYRRSTRNYILPDNVDCDNLNSLVVCAAQKKAIEAITSQKKVFVF